MRKHLAQDFEHIDHIDLHGNVRKNPKLSGTTHNVFGIQIGVGITLAVKRKGAASRLRYHRAPELWRKGEKLEFLETSKVRWQTLTPLAEHTWLMSEHVDEYRQFVTAVGMFDLYTLGLKTARDSVAYDWQRAPLAQRMKGFIANYNAEVHRHRAKRDESWSNTVVWSEGLKLNAVRGNLCDYSEDNIRPALYRPFAKRWVYFDRLLNERVYQWPNVIGRAMCLTDIGSEKPFMVLICDLLPDLHLVGAASTAQCFPLSHLKDSAVTQFRQHYSDPSITKEAVFHYIYALLHHPEYRERFAANLKRELPRIPFAPDFTAFATAGKELARLHVEYESLKPWPLEFIESPEAPYSERVTKMKLSVDRLSLIVNDSLTLQGIPAEAFEYRLGNRSALEWIIDQYQVKGDSDPNREDDPGYIVRLVGQVVRVSLETVQIVTSLPSYI
jgi:predicted helicase